MENNGLINAVEKFGPKLFAQGGENAVFDFGTIAIVFGEFQNIFINVPTGTSSES